MAKPSLSRTRVTRICPICKETFHPLASEVKRGKGIHCSERCKNSAAGKIGIVVMRRKMKKALSETQKDAYRKDA